eukprot:Awhi_evm1s13340
MAVDEPVPVPSSHNLQFDILIDGPWLNAILDKPDEKIQKWLTILQDEEILTLEDLKSLMPTSWDLLALPLVVKEKLKKEIAKSDDDRPQASELADLTSLSSLASTTPESSTEHQDTGN